MAFPISPAQTTLRRLCVLSACLCLSARAAAPFAATQPATPLIAASVTLNGMALANGEGTTAWFEWGKQGSYSQQTVPTDVGAGSLVVRLSAPIAGLTGGAVYQCRLVATNASGTSYGAKMLFTAGQKVIEWGETVCGAVSVPPGLTNLVGISANSCYSMVLKNDRTVLVWGNNGYLNLPSFASNLTNIIAIAQGDSHSLAIQADGTVVAWGDNSYGQTNVPAGLQNVVAVSAGATHSLALGADGTVAAWGDDSSGQTNVPPGLSNVVAIASGLAHNLALKADGTVVAWGRNLAGETNVPPGLTNAVAVSAGEVSSEALLSDGNVVSWGTSLNQPSGLATVVALAEGGFHSLSVNDDGSVAAWAIGTSAAAYTNLPPRVTNISAVACGDYQSLALGANVPPQASVVSASGPANIDLVITLVATDANGDTLSFRIASLPTQGNLYQYAGGGRGAPILTSNASVSDISGRVIFAPATNGFGTPYDSFTFVANDGETDSAPGAVTVVVGGQPYAVTQPATDLRSTTATLNGSALANGLPTRAWFEWGNRGGYSQTTAPIDIANSTTMFRMSRAINGLTNGGIYQCRLVVSNAAGVASGAAQLFTTGAKIRTWGSQTNPPTPITGVVAVAAGLSHSLALRADGTVAGWGGSTGTNVPAGLSNVVAISASPHSLALKSDGTVVGWGENYYGQATVPAGLVNVVGIAAGYYHSLALKTDGSVVGWGNNYWSQANPPAGLSNVVAVAAGEFHSVALKLDGTVVAWGANNYGQLNVPADLTNVVAVGAGDLHSVALKADATVVAWGAANLLPGLSNVMAVAAGNLFNLYLKADGTALGWGENNYGQTNVPSGLTSVVAVSAGDTHSLALAPELPPQAFSQTNSALVNLDQVIALAAYDANGDPLNLRISSLPAQGTLYQLSSFYPAGGGRGAPILTPGTVVSNLSGSMDVIFAPATNGVGSPYTTFQFIANDGQLDSTPATVTINVLLPAAPRLTGSHVLTNGSFQLDFTGGANATYRVWGSSNLVDWVVVGTAQRLTSNTYRFVDGSATNAPWRFYRAGAP